MNLGDKLKYLRNKANLSLKKLGKELDLSDTAISKYENNKSIPTATVIIKYSQIFKVTTDYILLDTNYITYNNNEQNLIEKYNKLTEKNKGRTEQFINERLKEQQCNNKSDNFKSCTSKNLKEGKIS